MIGLDVAFLLAERGYGSHITIVAEHLPGDTSLNYTSPWYTDIPHCIRDVRLTALNRAGANFSAISGGDANALRWDKFGYKQMMKLSEEHGVEACISKTPSYEYWDEAPPSTKVESMAEYLHDVIIAILEVGKLAHIIAVQNPPEN